MRLALLIPLLAAAPLTPAAGPASPVVVELFTSEGCSSCPPADLILAEIEKQLGPQVIVLSEHVDYWDYLGWKDRFSSADFTARQKRYAANIGGDAGVYTPQMVVDGRVGFVGSNGRRATSEIKKAARETKLAVSIVNNGGRLTIETAGVPADAAVLLALTESNIETSVKRGENSGKSLRHTGVVRSWTVLGKPQKGAPFRAEFAPQLSSNWKTGDLQAVVLVEDRGNMRILGAAAVKL